jgi:hypothetical protein
MWVCAMSFGFLFGLFVLSSIYFINGVTCAIEHILHNIYLWSKVVSFVLSHWNLSNASWCVLGIFEKLLMSRCTNLVGAMVWKLLMIEPFFQLKWIKSKLKKLLEFGCVLGVLDLIEFISLFFELRCGWYWSLKKNLLLEIQTICKYWVWKEKSVEPSMCSHCWNFQF